MIDEPFRRWLARHAAAPVPVLHRLGVTPNALSWTGLLLALVATALVARGALMPGVVAWLVSRVADGYDGLLARYANTNSLFGGYLDLTLDMLAYSAMACAFAYVMPADRLLWLFVLTGYVLAVTTTLALSSLAERANRQIGGNRSIQFTAGLAEAGETTIVYVLLALMPSLSRWILMVWVGLLIATTVQRTLLARRILRP
ncbi:CDP-alcohol phosphatidyltransferase family protein [Gemmatimonas sp.]|jgi:phosphatidylglycerophosphate synthase|uniref:CDP-alcohol phosphatidyltransferase family protein n=1 Tax=Gemmatimonas sp. TaxID=1962908 RepID=UPI0022CB314C|nr:CDP-alcohol phosphatidyltransferase family protein [Gemmatimonas sp.]MCZ8206369.1 CDP-alcohol phosphatidyltransferase family protein [Gemmatimonas sp.]